MSAITTHVLDTSRGRPASGVPIVLARRDANGGYAEVARGETDADGRLRTLTEGKTLEKGVYRLVFDTGKYFAAIGVEGFYPEAAITFEVRAPNEHHHVPLLLQPFGFATYRGS